MKFIKKIIFYRNIYLIFRILYYQFLLTTAGGRRAFALLKDQKIYSNSKMTRETIDRYVMFGLRIGAMFGLLNSCLTRSVILCRLYRENGIPARVAFGLTKGNGKLNGHCWLVCDENSAPSQPEAFHSTVIYPENNHKQTG